MALEQQFSIENNTQIFYILRPKYIGSSGTTDSEEDNENSWKYLEISIFFRY
jgi:hypothetical protein